MNNSTILTEHGGEVDIVAERYGIPRDRWLDLSTGINPTPYPLPELARDYWHRLPDAALDAWLRETAAAYYGAPDADTIVPAPGSQAVIQWLPRLLTRSRVAIVGPTYGEHAACWAAADHIVTEVDASEHLAEDTSVVVVVNPNNPDGRICDPERLFRFAGNRLLVVDEAFADVAPDFSLAAHAGRPNIVVLRSVGKFFGLAGMRLGFALAGEPLATRLRRALGPWAVSGPAAAIGAVALADDAWVRAARVRLTSSAGRLDGLLMRAGLRVVGGTSLFRLVEHARADEMFQLLAQQAILVRSFVGRPQWLRFGIPADDNAFDRLAGALAVCRGQTLSGGRSSSQQRPSTAGRPSGQMPT
jgi:cobalamin biosynthesis protein CobC